MLPATTDAVMLAAALDPPPGARVLDLGCGIGSVALRLWARRPDLRLTGWEIAPEIAAAAEAAAAAAGAADSVRVERRDARAPFRDAPFDAVVSNPPFHDAARSAAPADPNLALAKLDQDLPGWIDAAARACRPGGQVAVIFRADRLEALLAAATPKLGALEIIPLWPRAGRPAKRVILRAIKGGKAPTRLSPGLVLHDAAGWTAAAAAINAGRASLDAALAYRADHGKSASTCNVNPLDT